MIKKLLLLALAMSLPVAQAAEWSGNIALQNRYFLHDPLVQNTEQHSNHVSLSAEPEFYHSWDDNQQSLTFTPYVRIDQYDNERSHGDIRELNWQRVFENWELKAGISKVYWGVTESQHLVDVINQTDFVENIDGEDKLGQPMIRALYEHELGTLNLFILPGFRERTFADAEGRPRAFPVVDTNQAQYESSAEENHIDYALRWFQMVGNWEIGLSWFKGTSREPVFLPATRNGQPVLLPYYPQMTQSSLDAQMTTEEWLWKLELISRNWRNTDSQTQLLVNENYLALTAGFEYTFVGVLESDADLGLVMEYLYDDRDEATTGFFENDLMTGLRLALNDAQSTEALLGVIIDVDTQESLLSLEASRRLGDRWKLELEIRSFQHVNRLSRLQSLKNDDFIQLDLAYYF
ncbi:MAG: hypothetical protein OQL06_09195 [Gammaproteobacteria bacterium]|nr:hypothetical protein [Gammaproteobacteria bacterium]